MAGCTQVSLPSLCALNASHIQLLYDEQAGVQDHKGLLAAGWRAQVGAQGLQSAAERMQYTQGAQGV
eukprot:589442-Pelagomonas_calceolata.AAC.4